MVAGALLIAACADNTTADNTAMGDSASDAASQPAQEQPGAAASTAATATPADTATLAAGEPVQVAIYGQWQVVQARLTDPSARVQAYGDAQLAAMKGLRLNIARNSAKWIGSAIASDPASYSSFISACANPASRESGSAGGVVLTCADGQRFGPPDADGEPTLQLEGDDNLTVRWFDGVTLELRRAS